MDYEWQIKRLDAEIAHLQAMKDLMRERLDAHDQSFSVVGDRMDRIEATLEKLAVMQTVTEQKLQTLADKFNGLVDLLTREHGNGQRH